MIDILEYKKGQADFPCVLLLGYFDGVHIGHRRLIQKAKEIAAKRHAMQDTQECRVGIMTFYEAKQGAQIYNFKERLSLFEKLGLNFVYVAKYNESFRNLSADKFLKTVISDLKVEAFVCGEDFRFGKGAQGDVSFLKKFSNSHEICAYIEPLVQVEASKAAATLAKRYLDEGDMLSLTKLLGEPYFIQGNVTTEGRKVGRSLGFPTANIHVGKEKYPLRYGVYAVSSIIDGKVFKGIANYGNRPTFQDERIVLEAFFDGFSGNLYGRELKLEFLFYIRPIEKFESEEKLILQLKEDLKKIR